MDGRVTPRRGRWSASAPALIATAALVAAGCSSVGPPAASPSPSALPDGVLADVSAEVRQSRADWGDRVVQVRVRNDADEPLTVTRAELSAATVEGTATSDPGWVREVPPGSHRDASVALGPAVCGATASAAAEVRLTIEDGAGRSGTTTVPAADPQAHLARIHAEDCAAAAVARGLRIEPDGALDVADRDGALVATVGLVLTPVAGGPAVTLDRVDGTVLLDPPDGAAWAGPVGPVTARTRVELPATPGRCDPHAVAEDKRGAYLGLHTTVDGMEQPVFYVWLGDDVRGALYDYIAQACGWPAG